MTRPTFMLTRIARPLSVAMVAIGLVWFLQGVNILPGSFMTGDPKWAVIGGVLVVAGAALRVAKRPRS